MDGCKDMNVSNFLNSFNSFLKMVFSYNTVRKPYEVMFLYQQQDKNPIFGKKFLMYINTAFVFYFAQFCMFIDL